MASGESSSNGYGPEIQGKSLDFGSGHKLEATSASKNMKDDETMIRSKDSETMELYARDRSQEKELRLLREQIAFTSIRESELLNEKYALERKFSELRMALDEKQSEVITSASNELARRKGDLEVNLNLLNELKAVEDEKHIYTAALLEILSEYGTLPHATNASALANSIKHLHDQLQLKIRSSEARLTEVNSMISSSSRNGFVDKTIAHISPKSSQLMSTSTGAWGVSHYSHYADGSVLEGGDDAPGHVRDNNSKRVKSLAQSAEVNQFPNNEGLLGAHLDIIGRNVGGHIGKTRLEGSGFLSTSDQRSGEFAHPPTIQDGAGSFAPEDDGPGIEGFQIIGDAQPGCKLLGCGFPVHGTSLCMFQWVRHYPDGTRQYIEGATNPDYLVTADDVDKIIAVECIPMDEQGRQGDLVRIFANDNNKITCDDVMQQEIDLYISNGSATFPVLILLDSVNWEPATLLLRRLGFQVKVHNKQDVVISKKFSKDLLIKIPSGPTGLSAQFVLIGSNDSSYPFSTSNDVRVRDTIVLTMRIFQSKALDEKRKGKA